MRSWMLVPILAFAPIAAQARGLRGVTVVTERGTCTTFALPHIDSARTKRFCAGKLEQASLPNGRVIFMFGSKPHSLGIEVSFVGSGPAQRKLSANVVRQPIDQVLINLRPGVAPRTEKARGECTFDNPYTYAGKAYVRCRARTKVGIFRAEIIDARATTPVRFGHATAQRESHRGRLVRVFTPIERMHHAGETPGAVSPIVTGDTIPSADINTILFLREPCPLPIMGASQMRRAWEDQANNQVGCWYPLTNGGFVYIDGTGREFPTSAPWQADPLAILHKNDSATITQPHYNAVTYLKQFLHRQLMRQLRQAQRKELP